MPVIEQRDPFAPPDEEPTILGPLAERDPNAALEESAEYVVTGAVSFDDVLRRARRQGFVAGAAAGGLAGAVVAAVLALATSRPVSTATAAPAEVAVLEPAAPEATPASPVVSPARPARAATAPVAVRVAARSAAAPQRPAPPVADASADRADGAGPSPAAAAPAAPAASSDRPEAVAGPAEAAALPAADEPPAAARPPQERDVTAALGARRDDLDACVAETPGDGAVARGRRFRMLVVVEPSGQVSEARPYDEEIAATPLGVCLARLARETTFPPFEGEPARIELRVRAEE